LIPLQETVALKALGALLSRREERLDLKKTSRKL